MPNNYLSVLYKLIIKVENENVGLKVWGGGGQKHTIAPPIKNVWGGGGAHAPLAPPASYASDIYIYIPLNYMTFSLNWLFLRRLLVRLLCELINH